ncbi:transcription initiation factor TFIID subunit 4-like isoform X3 [Portunus trituberculatus]|uniref:transcription initiation factor TFIID subunit 4-like isoform X3 n=1 Tax=Portunus trituberculatus TaxID=210409 RepID=UPI001E1CFCDA|nr:transcription initiation factor TFIID subunit 4-like isoform X3 [Portunus trituberculatus]
MSVASQQGPAAPTVAAAAAASAGPGGAATGAVRGARGSCQGFERGGACRERDVSGARACAVQCAGEAGTIKMAASNSLDEVLCADVDPSAVAAIVGPLDTPRAAAAKTAAHQPLNGSANGGISNNAAVLVEGRTNCGKIGVRGPAVSGGKVVVSGVGAVQAGGGQGAGAAGGLQGGAALQAGGEQQQQQAGSSKGAAGGRPVYGVVPTPMTGAQGTQVVNGGVSGTGTGAAPQGSLQSQLALKGLTKVVTAAGQAAVIMSKPGTVTAVASSGQAGAVPLPQSMQILNMRPGQTIKTTQGTTITPRMILNQAQVLPAGIRPGQPGQITLGPLQGLPPGAQGHLLVKTENGQLQLLRVNTATATPGPLPAAVTTTTTLQQPANAAYRFQAPQNTVALTSSNTTTTSIATQAVPTITAPTTVAVTPGTTVAGTTVVPTQPTSAAPTPTTQQSQATSVGSQTISAESAKTKCKNFLATLLKLASEQRAPVARNVRTLIQGLIDGRVEPEAFTEELQKDLNSSPQPCLVPFLKKTLPYLRLSLAKHELTIEGVRPPPFTAVSPVSGVTTVIPAMSMARPVAPTTSGTVRMVAPTAVASVSTATVVQRPAGTTTATSAVAAAATPSRVVAPVRMQGGKTVVAAVRHNTPAVVVAATSTTTTATATASATPTATPSAAAPTAATLPAAAKAVTINKALPTKDKDKGKDKVFTYSSSYSSSGAADDDINDVAAMGGVNLGEESQRILDSTGFVGTQIRSCKDENFLFSAPLTQRIRQICSKYGLDDAPKDVVALVSHATQERLKTIVEKLAVIADHRLEIIKQCDARYEVKQDVKAQLRFLEELDKLEKKRKDEQEREMLLRAAKSRSKSEDPEQAKLKAKAKEMQRVEMEEMRQRDANRTALNALQGPKKKPKLDLSVADEGGTFSGTFTQKSMPLRPRIKRVNMRDLMFLMEQEKELNKSPLLYRSYLK